MTNREYDMVIIGWYDGITEALVRSASGKWMYASMVSWSQEKQLRIYGLVEADDAFVTDVRVLSAEFESNGTAVEELWPVLRSRIMALLQNTVRLAELRICRELDGEVRGTMQVEASEIVSLMGKGIEDTLDRERFERLSGRFRSGG